MDTHELIIIGAGAMGSASAYHAARAGVNPLVLEQFEVGHKLGSSHGGSRITRYANPDVEECRVIPQTFEMWRQLEEESGEHLLEITGSLMVGPDDEDFLVSTRAALDANGFAYRHLQPQDIAAEFPQFALPDNWVGLYQADAGKLDADRWLRALIDPALAPGGTVGLFLLFFVFQFVGLLIQALVSGAPVRLIDLIMMKFRKVNAREIVYNRISAKKAGINIPSDDLESHFLAGGRVTNVVRAMIAADRAKIALTWEGATAIDLAGRDILEAVKTSVDPKVIDVPLPGTGKTPIDAVAKDGIQLKAKARVTVRTNIARLVGGATEETVVARVGEGVVSAIGSAARPKRGRGTPGASAKAVRDKGSA